MRDFCNQLPEHVLKNEVHCEGAEEFRKIAFAECYAEDMVNPSGEGIEPVSDWKLNGNENQKKEYENAERIYFKGDPKLYFN